MKINSGLLSVVPLLVGMSANAQSVPMKDASCRSNVKVKAVANGNGVFFDSTCKTAYVLPPIKAHVSISAIANTYNLPRCREFNSFNREADVLAERLAQIEETLFPKTSTPKTSVTSGMRVPPGTGGATSPTMAGANEMPADSDQLKKQREEVRSFYKEGNELRDTFDNVLGATASFLYVLDTPALVASYQAANPNLRFEAMPLSSAYLSFTPVQPGSTIRGLAVLGMSVPGLGALPLAADSNDLKPTGDAVDASAAPKIDLSSSRIFGGSMAGSMQLSLTGACPYYDLNKGTMPSNLSENDFTAYLAANLQYSYALQVFRSYKASYNLSSLVTRILSSESHGGLFSSKTLNTFINDEKTNDWFNYESESNDPRFNPPYQVQEIKSDLMDRVVKQIALAKVGGPIAPTDLSAPHADGAAIAGKELHQCPHFWCQAAGFVFDVAEGAFGSTSAANKFIANNNYWSHDNVVEKKMLEYFGSAGFVGKSNPDSSN